MSTHLVAAPQLRANNCFVMAGRTYRVLAVKENKRKDMIVEFEAVENPLKTPLMLIMPRGVRFEIVTDD